MKKKTLSLLLLSLTPLLASASAHPVFILSAKKAVIAQDSSSQDLYLISLKQTSPKSLYMLSETQMGYVSTTDLLNAVNQWEKKNQEPVLVALKTDGQHMLLGLGPSYKTANDDWTLHAIAPMESAKLPPHSKIKPGTYQNITISSDMFPVDVASLPHSSCSINDTLDTCRSHPLVKK